MTIAVGDRLPEAQMIQMGDGGPEPVTLSSVTAGRKIALFAVPGAYTGVCSDDHVPSFVKNADALAAKGVEAIVCVAVNDPFVLKAWGAATGATDAGIRMLSDAEGTFTKAVGLDFDAPPAGLIGRSRRYAMLVEDGVVKVLNVEETPGTCTVSSGDTLLEAA